MRQILIAIVLLTLLIGCSSNTQTYTDSQGSKVEVQKLPPDAPLEVRVEQLNELSYTVTYEMSMETDDEDMDEMPTLEITQYVDSAGGLLRQDGEMDSKKIKQYLLEDGAYVCVMSDSEWSCAATAQVDVQDIGQSIQAAAREYALPSTEPRRLAGTEVACYALSSMGISVEYCFSPEGVPLLMVTGSDFFSMELKATSYSIGVSASDFELPAEPSGSIDDLVIEESASVNVPPCRPEDTSC